MLKKISIILLLTLCVGCVKKQPPLPATPMLQVIVMTPENSRVVELLGYKDKLLQASNDVDSALAANKAKLKYRVDDNLEIEIISPDSIAIYHSDGLKYNDRRFLLLDIAYLTPAKLDSLVTWLRELGLVE